ncbi:MAG: hypothetical protein R3E65_05500 [Steroidobacteraceae bacterium]
MVAIEQSAGYRGARLCLMGRDQSPLDGIRPRAAWHPRTEASPTTARCDDVATDPIAEGELRTFSELARGRGLRASRIAHGVPVGGELEYIDGGTLARALAGRQSLG